MYRMEVVENMHGKISLPEPVVVTMILEVNFTFPIKFSCII